MVGLKNSQGALGRDRKMGNDVWIFLRGVLGIKLGSLCL